MGYHTSNAAYAYDMQPDPAVFEPAYAPAPVSPARPRLDVVPGAGREASQAVSPVFTHCIKVFCVLAALFCAIGLARVTIASATAATLNDAATLSSKLTTAQEESASLEVMRSVYGASTRIRDLAEGYGMVAAEGGVTLDFTEYADASSAAAQDAATSASAGAQVPAGESATPAAQAATPIAQ